MIKETMHMSDTNTCHLCLVTSHHAPTTSMNRKSQWVATLQLSLFAKQMAVAIFSTCVRTFPCKTCKCYNSITNHQFYHIFEKYTRIYEYYQPIKTDLKNKSSKNFPIYQCTSEESTSLCVGYNSINFYSVHQPIRNITLRYIMNNCIKKN